ncbi:hypothetical protein YPPY58_1609, partial [Yersinia pestis PY-58]
MHAIYRNINEKK